MKFDELRSGMVLFDILDNSMITSGYVLWVYFIKSKTPNKVIYDYMMISNGGKSDDPNRVKLESNCESERHEWLLSHSSSKEILDHQIKLSVKAVFDKDA